MLKSEAAEKFKDRLKFDDRATPPATRAKYALYYITVYVALRADVEAQVIADRLHDWGHDDMDAAGVASAFAEDDDVRQAVKRHGAYELTPHGAARIRALLKDAELGEATSRRPTALVIAGVALVAALLSNLDDIANTIHKWHLDYESNRAESLSFARFEEHVALGRLGDARDAAAQLRPDASKGRFASLLLDAFSGLGKWDSKDPNNRRELLEQLRSMPRSVLNREAQILLEYRLDRSDSTSALYFRRMESELTSPYVRFLAAREAAADTSWTIPIMRSVIQSCSGSDACALALQAQVWLAGMYRGRGDWVAAKRELQHARQIQPCREMEGTTIEVRYRGELLLLARHEGDEALAGEQRAKLAELATHPPRRIHVDLNAVSLNARYRIAEDCLARREYAAAEREAASGLAIADSAIGIRDQYPYVCAMLGVVSAHSKILQGKFGEDVERSLVFSADELGILVLEHADSFHGSAATCHYLLSELYCRQRKQLAAVGEFEAAEKLRSRAQTFDAAPLGCDETRSRVVRLLK